MGRRTRILAALLLAALTVGAFRLVRQADSANDGAPTGQRVPPQGPSVGDFSLRDHRGKTHTLGELADKKAIVLVFLGTSCPLAKLYAPRLVELHREFEPRGVAFLGINANAQDLLADLAAYVRVHQIPFPVLKDPDHTVADRLEVVRSPEAYVLDQAGFIRYRGRIDDQYAIGVQRPHPTCRHLASALEAVLAGRSVSVPRTEAVGCRIGRTERGQSRGEVTYARHVSRILQRRCVECHRQGGVAPFPLTGCKDAASWAPMIREVVQEGRMPPWFANPRHGQFGNDPRLSQEEKLLLNQWIDNGCPEGDPVELPEPAPVVEGWRLPPPDQVVYMSANTHTVPAEGGRSNTSISWWTRASRRTSISGQRRSGPATPQWSTMRWCH